MFSFKYLFAESLLGCGELTDCIEILYSLLRHIAPSEVLPELDEETKQIVGLFGVLPVCPRKQQTMLMLEIIRIHSRHPQDYRNALRMCDRLAHSQPENPHVLSKCGRTCLEFGRKAQAQDFFDSVYILVSAQKSSEQYLSQKQDDLKVLIHLNDGFMAIYDNNYEAALKHFQQVDKIKSANLVAANNIATCQVFLNNTGKAIETLKDLIKMDGAKYKINEDMVSNMMVFYEVYYPSSADVSPNILENQKNDLIEILNKKGLKDAVLSTINFKK